MRVIVAGSRTCWVSTMRLGRELAAMGIEPSAILHGGCPTGADATADRWAKERGVDLDVHPAEWRRYGPSAGPRRNVEMSLRADALLAFWNGVSRGTKHMIDVAKAQGLEVRVVRMDEEGLE